MLPRFNPTLFLSAIGLAAGLTVGATGVAQAANVTVCFEKAMNEVALVSGLTGVESGVVINDASGNALVKANNYFNNGAGSYWTSGLPQTITLPAGCSTFYFMMKTKPLDGKAGWICNAPVASPGELTVIYGSVGKTSTPSALAIVPGTPNDGKTDLTAACPRGW